MALFQKCVILQHDNARLHSARITREKLEELDWEVIYKKISYCGIKTGYSKNILLQNYSHFTKKKKKEPDKLSIPFAKIVNDDDYIID